MIFSFAGKLIRLAQSAWYGQYATDTQPSRPEEEGRRSMRASKSALDQVRWLEMKAMRVPPDERIARGYDGLAGYVEQMAILARQNNAKFLVVLAPSQIEIDSDLRGRIIAAFDGDPRDFDGVPPAQRVGESLAARGIPFVDLTAALVAAGPARVYNRDDPHWNRRGNFVAAETIAMALRPLLASP
ncbi:MAG: hypothetical protein AB7M05_17770 [Alphaproteobacteria bacterium]